MSKADEIRRYPDGSIDIEHYVKVGRRLRAQAALGAGSYAIAWLRRIFHDPLIRFPRFLQELPKHGIGEGAICNSIKNREAAR